MIKPCLPSGQAMSWICVHAKYHLPTRFPPRSHGLGRAAPAFRPTRCRSLREGGRRRRRQPNGGVINQEASMDVEGKGRHSQNMSKQESFVVQCVRMLLRDGKCSFCSSSSTGRGADLDSMTDPTGESSRSLPWQALHLA